jgi:hypothetical protein
MGNINSLCDVKHIMTIPVKMITSVLKVLTLVSQRAQILVKISVEDLDVKYIITSITACSDTSENVS